MSHLRRAEDDGRIAQKPSRTSTIRYLAEPKLTPLIRELIERSALPLRGIETCFAVDSSGFASTTNNRWFDHKHGGTKKKVRWAKLHLICGVQTNIVTAADCTPYESADVRFFDEFVRTTAQNFRVEEVSADKAYLSHKNIRVVDEVGGTPYIPLRKGSVAHVKGQKAGPVMGEAVSPLHSARGELSSPLPQAVERRDHLLDDKVQIRRGGAPIQEAGPAQVK